MSEPFPSPEYIKLCTQPEVAEKLREEWEPRPGDWALSYDSQEPCLVVATGFPGADTIFIWSPILDGETALDVEDFIPLFTLRQLIEMLEERGYQGTLAWRKGAYLVILFEGLEGQYVRFPSEDDFWKGPDPATALLRAWLEVVKEERCPKRS